MKEFNNLVIAQIPNLSYFANGMVSSQHKDITWFWKVINKSNTGAKYCYTQLPEAEARQKILSKWGGHKIIGIKKSDYENSPTRDRFTLN